MDVPRVLAHAVRVAGTGTRTRRMQYTDQTRKGVFDARAGATSSSRHPDTPETKRQRMCIVAEMSERFLPKPRIRNVVVEELYVVLEDFRTKHGQEKSPGCNVCPRTITSPIKSCLDCAQMDCYTRLIAISIKNKHSYTQLLHPSTPFPPPHPHHPSTPINSYTQLIAIYSLMDVGRYSY